MPPNPYQPRATGQYTLGLFLPRRRRAAAHAALRRIRPLRGDTRGHDGQPSGPGAVQQPRSDAARSTEPRCPGGRGRRGLRRARRLGIELSGAGASHPSSSICPTCSTSFRRRVSCGSPARFTTILSSFHHRGRNAGSCRSLSCRVAAEVLTGLGLLCSDRFAGAKVGGKERTGPVGSGGRLVLETAKNPPWRKRR